MLQHWLNQQKHDTDASHLLGDALRAIGRHDVITQCMTDMQVVDDRGRQEALSALVERTYSITTSKHHLVS